MIIYSRSHFAPAILGATVIQIFEFTLTLHLRPFIQKMDNVAYILEQFLWIVTFLVILILSFELQRKNPGELNSNSINILSLIVAFLLLLIIMIFPVV